MATTTVTFEEVLFFRAAANRYLQMNAHGINKLSFALTKMLSRTKHLELSYNEQVEEARITYASKEDGNVIKNPDGMGYKFTSDNQKKCEREIKRIYQSPVEIENHIVPVFELPAAFNLTFMEPFTKFVIEELSEEDFLKLQLGPKK